MSLAVLQDAIELGMIFSIMSLGVFVISGIKYTGSDH